MLDNVCVWMWVIGAEGGLMRLVDGWVGVCYFGPGWMPDCLGGWCVQFD